MRNYLLHCMISNNYFFLLQWTKELNKIPMEDSSPAVFNLARPSVRLFFIFSFCFSFCFFHDYFLSLDARILVKIASVFIDLLILGGTLRPGRSAVTGSYSSRHQPEC